MTTTTSHMTTIPTWHVITCQSCDLEPHPPDGKNLFNLLLRVGLCRDDEQSVQEVNGDAVGTQVASASNVSDAPGNQEKELNCLS